MSFSCMDFTDQITTIMCSGCPRYFHAGNTSGCDGNLDQISECATKYLKMTGYPE